MGWSADFISELGRHDVTPKFLLRFLEDYHSVIGREGTISSHSREFPTLIGDEVSVEGGRVSPGSWRYIAGGFSVLVIGEPGGSVFDVIGQITRGNLAELLVGFPGWEEEDYERVAIGALIGVDGVAPEFRFQFNGLLVHWRTKHEKAAANMALFDSLDLDDADLTRVNTAVRAAYDPASDTTIAVNSVASFELGDSKGALLCDDSTYGDPFYVTYTGTSGGNTFTGVSTSSLHHTTRVQLSTAGFIYACAYLEGHPVDIARQVLLSTGTGANSVWDDLPRTWGFAALSDWVDVGDMNLYKSVIGNKSGTDHDWSIIVEEGQRNAIGWLEGILSPAGIWLVMRQGQISLRCAQNTDETSANRYEDLLTSGISITSADIESIDSYQFWFQEVPAEAHRTVVWYNAALTPYPDKATVSDVFTKTLPAYSNAEHDCMVMLWQGSAQPALDIAYRCHIWETRIPEYARITCRGLRLAQLCPGDIVLVTCSAMRGRLTTTAQGWSEVSCMVIGVTVDWMDARVTLELVAPSEKVVS